MSNKKTPIINICFRIWGDDLNPEKVTKLLKIQPTEAARKGDVKISKKTGAKVTAKTGKWFLKTGEYVSSILVIDHVKFILTLLQQLKGPLNSLEAVDKMALTFIIGVNEDDDAVEFDIDPDLLKKISQQNIELSFTII